MDVSLKRKLISDDIEDSRKLSRICDCLNKSSCVCLKSKNLTENDVGITEHVNSLSTFTGVIKQRYSDFIVNEIDTSNKVIELTDLTTPQPEPEVTQDAINNLGIEVVKQLETLLNSPNSTEQVVIKLLKEESKEERTKIHATIRQNFHQLQSVTEEKDGVKVIIVQRNLQGNQRKSNNWPVNQPNYLKFVMFKENKDTMDAINIIAKLLRIKPSSFSYSGVKDKRAKTTQLVTVYRILAEKIARLKLRGIILGNYEYVKTPLQLGDLNGNRFKIVLRKVMGEGDIDQILTNLRNNGFVNYYGMQRFGTSVVPTHHIGRALLLGQWQQAIELIMKPRDGENEELAECRQLWWKTRDSKAAYNKLVKKHIIEAHLLRGLSQSNPNDFVNALNFIPRNTRLMYIHSYQSYIWNRIVSERIKKFGMTILCGDLYKKREEANVNKRNDEILIYDALTEDSNVDVFDVAMPLPGSNVKLPNNEVAEIYERILKEEGIDFKKSYSNVKSYALSGGYRNMVVQPKNMAWNVVNYDDATVPLILSDQDLLEKLSLVENKGEGSSRAVCIEFSLPSSSYATMALREIINVDTSAAFQSSLN